MSSIILLGSSGRKGKTESLCCRLAKEIGCDILNLDDYTISFFDYKHVNKSDGFVQLITQLLKHDHIIFASPVYWYSMSAQMKVFFDRMTDLLTIEQQLGRELKGKCCSVVATGSDKIAPPCFIEPFKLSAAYLTIEFKEFLYCPTQNENFLQLQSEEIDDFISKVT